MSENKHTISSASRPRPAVNLRSVLIGLWVVVIICGLSPYNDFAVNNTYLIGNFLPIGFILILFILVIVINAPLLRWWPKIALQQGELAVITVMALCACSIPGSGLMRYLPASIVGTYTSAAEQPDVARSLEKAGLPQWLRPNVGTENPVEIGYSDVYSQYLSRSPDGTVPWGHWVGPFLYWGIFFISMWGLTLCLSIIVNKQWAENEKLSFPLASVYTSLIEQPAPGCSVNQLFSSRSFWIAACAIFAVHMLNGLHQYDLSFPEIPRSFDFNNIFTDSPWLYMQYEFKKSEVYFSILGITYFLQTKTSFSIWFFIVVLQIVLMITGSQQYEITSGAQKDETFGGMVTLSLILVYTGRHHYWLVLKSMLSFRRDVDRELNQFVVAGWGSIACLISLVLFLLFMGSTPIGALLTSLSLVMMVMIVARVVAETGLIFVQINWSPSRLWAYSVLIPAKPLPTSSASFLATCWTGLLMHDVRESFATFCQQGLRVADHSIADSEKSRSPLFNLILAIALALIVGYVASACGMLWTEYHYASTLNSTPEAPINSYGIFWSVKDQILDPLQSYPNIPAESHSQVFHILLGSLITGSLSILRLSYTWWPLQPIGFIILYSWGTRMIWFSVFLGWLAKVVIVRIGGSKLYCDSRNVFIGLILGEALAAGFWMVISLILNALGYEYHRIMLLPV